MVLSHSRQQPQKRDERFDFEQVKVYKPDAKVYEMPVKKYNIEANEIAFLIYNTNHLYD